MFFHVSHFESIIGMLSNYLSKTEIEKINSSDIQGKSYAPYVRTDSIDFACNNLRFATLDECERYLNDLEGRWLMVRETASVISEDEPSYWFHENDTLEPYTRREVNV